MAAIALWYNDAGPIDTPGQRRDLPGRLSWCRDWSWSRNRRGGSGFIRPMPSQLMAFICGGAAEIVEGVDPDRTCASPDLPPAINLSNQVAHRDVFATAYFEQRIPNLRFETHA